MKFEGEELDGYKVVLRQFKGDIDIPILSGEVVELRVVAKVSEVSFQENIRDGKLNRVHVLHVKELDIEKG